MMKKNKLYLRKKTLLPLRRERAHRTFKLSFSFFVHPLFIALFSASVIGTLFGMMTLSLLDLEDRPHTIAEEKQLKEMTTTNLQQPQPTEGKQRSITFYTLQIGKFQQEANANALVKQLHTLDIESIIWEEDDAFYVLSGAFHKEQLARKESEIVKALAIDAFVKQWTVTLNVKRTPEENAWLERWITTWETTLQQLDENKNDYQTLWNELAQDLQHEKNTKLFTNEKEQVLTIVTFEDSLTKTDLLKKLQALQRLLTN